MNDHMVVERMGEQMRGNRQRPWVLGLLMLSITSLLVGRSFYLQIMRGGDFHVQAEGNRVSITPIMAPRGIIYDRFGEQLVENVASVDAIIDPRSMPDVENEIPLIDQLPGLISVSPDEVRDAINEARKRQRVVLLKKALGHDEALNLESALDSLPGVMLSSSSLRHYLYGDSLAHTLGYSSLVSADEIAENESLLRTDAVGKSGIEKQYDGLLRGVHGASYIEVDAAGSPQKNVGMDDPVSGNDLTLGIDLALQRHITGLLEEKINADQIEGEPTPVAGSVIAIDPRNGSVRAIVNYPSYDANVFTLPNRREGLAQYFEDERQPLLNRSVSGQYPPGSTIKPLIAAGGLQEKIIKPATTIESNGGLSIGPWHFPDWKAGGHGTTDTKKAIAESVNTFFYLLAGGDSTRDGMGVNKIVEYLDYFAWGRPTGIDIPGEREGLLPTKEWKQETKGEKWYIGDTYHLGIGQGDVLATPLQVAVATTAIANGGTVFEPHVLDEYESPDGKKVQIKPDSQELPIHERYVDIAREGMRQAVTDGSARRLSTLSIATAGKTGTAQFDSSDKTHAWFTSFGPFEEPELVITVLLEKGGKGDVAAVPLANEIWKWWIDNRAQ